MKGQAAEVESHKPLLSLKNRKTVPADSGIDKGSFPRIVPTREIASSYGGICFCGLDLEDMPTFDGDCPALRHGNELNAKDGTSDENDMCPIQGTDRQHEDGSVIAYWWVKGCLQPAPNVPKNPRKSTVL